MNKIRKSTVKFVLAALEALGGTRDGEAISAEGTETVSVRCYPTKGHGTEKRFVS